jgi:hypothetical protein
MSFLDYRRTKKSKDELFQGKIEERERQTTKIEETINEPVRCETCSTDFSSPQDFERHTRVDYVDILAKA